MSDKDGKDAFRASQRRGIALTQQEKLLLFFKNAPSSFMSGNGKYIYGFMRNGAKPTFTIPGIDSKPVFAISDNGVAAVVSDGPDGKLRPERKHLSAHHGVIKEVMKTSTILPLSFGVVADDEASIRKILNLNHDSFVKPVEKDGRQGRDGFKNGWDVENIFEFMVRKHRTLELFRDNIFLKPTGPRRKKKTGIRKDV